MLQDFYFMKFKNDQYTNNSVHKQRNCKTLRQAIMEIITGSNKTRSNKLIMYNFEIKTIHNEKGSIEKNDQVSKFNHNRQTLIRLLSINGRE